ncbi:hypothetical protein IT409_02100 [Candidatus Falkowbacteria bacterium]|nr:hypothetical protein [Candidatus Falkowbacteria bacterium]
MFNFIFGITLIVMGFMIAYKYDAIYREFGKIAWVEKNLGPGRSSLYYQVFGFVLGLIGGLVMFNLHTKLLVTVLGPLFSSMK